MNKGRGMSPSALTATFQEIDDWWLEFSLSSMEIPLHQSPIVPSAVSMAIRLNQYGHSFITTPSAVLRDDEGVIIECKNVNSAEE